MKELSIGKHISSIYRHQSIIINALFKDLGLGSGQYLFLIRLGENPGISQKSLSELIHIDRANTNRALKKLEALGYIKTIDDPEDRRNKCSTLTTKGEEIRVQLLHRLNKVTQLLSADIPEDELMQFIKTLMKVESNIQNAVKKLREDNHEN